MFESRFWIRVNTGEPQHFCRNVLARGQLVERSKPDSPRVSKTRRTVVELHAPRTRESGPDWPANRLSVLFPVRGSLEPTNNSAERALGSAVQWRKTDFGNRNLIRSARHPRLLTISQTCAQQNRESVNRVSRGRPVILFQVARATVIILDSGFSYHQG